jgi:Cu-Zn family superoxide dismutase
MPHSQTGREESARGGSVAPAAEPSCRQERQSQLELFVPQVTLGQGKSSLFNENGSAVVIHERRDDYRREPSGNAGARIACGIVEGLGADRR